MAGRLRLSLKGTGVQELFLTAIGAAAIIPALAFLYIAHRYQILSNLDTRILFGMTTLLSVSSMLLVRQTLKRIAALRDALVARRDGVQDEGIAPKKLRNTGARETHEIAEIVLEFNNLLKELKDNTQKLERIVFQSATLSDLTELTSTISDMGQLLKVVLSKTMKGVEADTGSIMILNSEGTHLKIAASEGLPPEKIKRTPVALDDCVSGRVILKQRPIRVSDVACDETFKDLSNQGEGSFMSLPLKIHGKPLGVLNVAKYEAPKGNQKPFSDNDLRFLTTLLNHISFALENARLLAEAKESAKKLKKVLKEKSTELDRTKKQMVEAERLRIVGELASGVAHELNNPLTVVLGYSQMLLMESNLGQSVREKLSKIQDQGIRAKKITQNLLLFARRHQMERESVDIHELLDRALEVVGYEMKTADVAVFRQYDQTAPRIALDAHQITQVFINLIFNAYQAMQETEGAGELRVETRFQDGHMTISVQDTGPGIAEENLGKVFDPFFTTKDIGKGTGLGLSISFGVIQEHDGSIRAENSPLKGTRFVVELPYASSTESAQDLHKEADKAQPEAKVRSILVVDDEAEVRELVSECLSTEGFQVQSTASGEQAIANMKDQDYDLVVCDFKMPGMDGKGLYQKVQTDPILDRYRQRIVFITGDTFNKQTQEFVQAHSLPCLNKPFMIGEFLQTVRMVSSA